MARLELCWGALIIFVALFLPISTAVSFVATPGNVAVHVGEEAILQCSVDRTNEQNKVTMHWYKTLGSGGSFVTTAQSVLKKIDAERYSLDTSKVGGVFSYNLTITNAEVADYGRYQCIAVIGETSIRSPLVSLSVLQGTNNEPLNCSFYPESPTVGQSVTFSCIAPRGISPDMLTWWIDGTVQIKPEADLASEHGISFVKTLAETDNFAEFTCLVGPSFSTRNSMNCSVTLLDKPIRVNVTPSVQNAVVAGNATFQCRGTATPPVQNYRWLYGLGNSAVKISESKGRFFVVNNGNSSSLTITGLNADDNGMVVRCVVLNAITKALGVAKLHVSTTQLVITSQETTPSSANTGTTVAMTFQEMTVTTPFSQAVMKSTTDETLDTTQNHTTTRNGISFVTDVRGCIKECAGEISPKLSPSDNGGGSENRAIAAVFSLLALCALLIIGVMVYIFVGYIRKRGTEAGGAKERRKSQKNEAIEGLSSPRLSISSNSVQDQVAGDSVRLKTIEVVVNMPSPEWQFQVLDVTIAGATQDANATGDSPSTVMTSDDKDGREDGGDVDALYAKPDLMKKTEKKQPCDTQGDGVEVHLSVEETPPSDVTRHSISVGTYDPDFVGCPMDMFPLE